MTIGEGGECRQTGKVRASHFASALSSSQQCLDCCRKNPNPSVHLSFHPAITHEQGTKILKLLCLRRRQTPNPEGQSNFFHSRTMASDLEKLTLIPAASRSAVKRPVHAGGPGLKKPTAPHHL
ncbi:hypothetical protein ILYODFUR_034262 [Ilyodon furcidens]|uniref:Uncharacterized protein n=1 Tax=Ilyodon furcidens TaxID=33524 RepID=A0ABV0TP65_9TELE